jgi:hypothetical protein
MFENFPNITREQYLNIFRPSNLFSDINDLEIFLNTENDHNLNDVDYNLALQEMITLCEEDELYEWCALIKKYMK